MTQTDGRNAVRLFPRFAECYKLAEHQKGDRNREAVSCRSEPIAGTRKAKE